MRHNFKNKMFCRQKVIVLFVGVAFSLDTSIFNIVHVHLRK